MKHDYTPLRERAHNWKASPPAHGTVGEYVRMNRQFADAVLAPFLVHVPAEELPTGRNY